MQMVIDQMDAVFTSMFYIAGFVGLIICLIAIRSFFDN